MEPLDSYELINFFEWVKKLDKTGIEIDSMREMLSKDELNIEKIEPFVETYIKEMNLKFSTYDLVSSIEAYWAYLIRYDCRLEVERDYWNKKIDEKSLSKLLDLMLGKKNKGKQARYLEPDIFKCVIFPFKNDDILKDLVKKHYDTLDKESANFLDIFYSKKELKKSGYDIKGQFSNLNIPIDYFPCIAIWKEKAENAILIPISGINEDGLFQLILYIIEVVKNNPNAQSRYYKKCFTGKVEQIKSNNEYRKSRKEPFYKKLVWNILFPIGCSIVSSIVAGLIVYLITK